MTSLEASPKSKPLSQSAQKDWLRILLPYGLAIFVQIPMLMLYFRQLWNRPHYQPFAVAILAAVGLALYRWPFDAKQPFHRSVASNVLLVLGLCFAFLGMLFVEPWFAACSSMLLVTSLFARTLDKDSLASLWPCSLPIYVYLMLPGGMDVRLITKLQQYSAVHTSKLLDLAGLGHHMTGTVIKIPGMKEYGIERACSGIQSFFTLLLVAVVYIVATRSIRTPKVGLASLSIILAVASVLISWNLSSPMFVDVFMLLGVAFALFSFLGFQAMALIISAVFWAIFMNTLRILSIPLANHFLQIDLSEGMSHDLLGYAILTIGILLILSTNQFLIFLFGPVDSSSGEAGRFGGLITQIWNETFSGTTNDPDEVEETNKRRAAKRQPIGASGRTFIWATVGLIVAFGVFQLIDVQRSKAHPNLRVRFFDADVTVDFEKSDLPEVLGENGDSKTVWRFVKDGYETIDRSQGSDLGQRSDSWRYRSRNVSAITSLDQTFPGWHELTTCYTNQGWKLISRLRIEPEVGESEEPWPFIEATFERDTGERGYLLFSHFNAFAEGMEAPREWGTLNSFVVRARNRMSHRIRAQLFQGEAYQTQVWSTSFNDFGDSVKAEVQERYLEVREQMRSQFKKKREQAEKKEAS